MKRREFMTLLGGAAAWPLEVFAQINLANPVISNPTDHFDNGRGRHNLGFVWKTPQDFGRLC